MGLGVLDGAADAGGDAVAHRAVGSDDVELDALAVGEGVAGKDELPDAVAGRGERVAVACPSR